MTLASDPSPLALALSRAQDLTAQTGVRLRIELITIDRAAGWAVGTVGAERIESITVLATTVGGLSKAVHVVIDHVYAQLKTLMPLDDGDGTDE